MADNINDSAATQKGRLTAAAFATTVAMWGVGYFCRLPGARVPSPVLFVLLVAALVAGGWAAGRFAGGGWRSGAGSGFLTSLVNLLVMGSLIGGDDPGRVRDAALVWVAGSLVLGAALGALGGALAGSRRAAASEDAGGTRARVSGVTALAGVAAAATLLLLFAGGVVTSEKAGLAVVDWPNSYGHNMFLYPLARMTGGIYFEHAHRLIGALVGFTVLVLTGLVLRVERRRAVKLHALGCLALVVVQGILGGLRVTGRFTMTQSPDETAPSIALAVVHGVTAQLFFTLVVTLAVVTSAWWRHPPPVLREEGAGTDRTLARVLAGVLLIQLVVGALQRHLGHGIMIHIAIAVGIFMLAVTAGARAWGIYGTRIPALRRAGLALIALVSWQLFLGFGAFIVTGAMGEVTVPRALAAAVATAHQTTGALLLALAATYLLLTHRVLAPAPAREPSPAAQPLTPSRG